MRNATVHVDGFVIPLIGVPDSETIETCDGCKRKFHLTKVTLTGSRFLCEQCLTRPATSRLNSHRQKSNLKPRR